MPAVIVRDIVKHFEETKALRGVSAEIPEGAFVTILGPSGAGKSTLLRLINGLEIPTSGSVEVGGLEVTPRSTKRIRSQVGMVFQSFNLVGRLNVMTNVLVGRLAHQTFWGKIGTWLYLFGREDLELAQVAIDHVGLTEKTWQRADTLSGGQMQRVGIARAIAQQPSIILADEPVASLDPVTSRAVLSLLRTTCDQQGITLVVNLHQIDLAREFSDYVIGLRDGNVVFDGPVSELTDDAIDHIYAHGADASGREDRLHAGGQPSGIDQAASSS